MSSTPAYRFGDSARAAQRLSVLAEVFEPSSRELLRSLADRDPGSVIDLGCGPGHTTRLLAAMFPRAHVTGIDSSAAFIDMARASTPLAIAYVVADVSRSLPVGASELIYARYLLTHLNDAQAVVERWGEHLTPRGMIVIEENEWIRTSQSEFARYLEIVQGMLSAQGQRLYIGAELATCTDWSNLTVELSEVKAIEVSQGQAASMFALNIATWKSHEYIQHNFAAQEIDELERNLQRLAEVNSGEHCIRFGRRRLVLGRSEKRSSRR